MALKAFTVKDNEIVGNSGGRTNKIFVNLFKNNKSKNLTRMSNIEAIKNSTFLISNTKKTFNQLQLAFIKALILRHFDLEGHIQIETNILGYAIGAILN